MNLNELRDRAYKTACEHGWHEEEYSNEHYLCLVISELMEALEADRKGKHSDVAKFKEWQGNSIPLTEETRSRRFKEDFEAYIKGTVEEELADAVTRLFDLAGLKEIDLENFDYEESDTFDYEGIPFTEAMFSITREITGGCTDDDVLEDKVHSVLNEIFSFCAAQEIDIEWHVGQKMRYNELRSFKHGNKKY